MLSFLQLLLRRMYSIGLLRRIREDQVELTDPGVLGSATTY